MKAIFQSRGPRFALRGARVSAVVLVLYFVVLAFFGLFLVLPIAIAVRGAFLDQTGALTLDYSSFRLSARCQASSFCR